jgi:hypothetical protein
MNRWAVGIALLAISLLALIPLASASSAADVSDCGKAERDREYDKGIQICSRALATGKLGASDQAFAYPDVGRCIGSRKNSTRHLPISMPSSD